ncbi:hypothetical protein C8Q77DRAFT_1051203 [Trametes polyzona]|nr:hypothetical protein C8Q77DRAFT_1051203 [Trametes polyzona]
MLAEADRAAEGVSSTSVYLPTPDALRAVRGILVQLGLPPELIFQIIDEATYYPTIHGTLPDAAHAQYEGEPGRGPGVLRVSASHDCPQGKNHAARLCLLTAPLLPGAPGETWRAKSVVWDLESHDQGWGGERGGTFHGAYSWFDAIIIRPRADREADGDEPLGLDAGGESGSSEPTATSLEEQLRALAHESQPKSIFDRMFCSPEDVAPTLSSLGYMLVTHGEGEGASAVWLVQRNRVAEDTFQEYHVEWDGRPHDAAEAELAHENGYGLGEGLLEVLGPGDIVGLWMRALYPGWANSVKSASVKILYDVY